LKRIKIISSVEAGAVVNQVNKCLEDGWQILSDYVVSCHAVSSNVMLVPCYVFYMIKEDNKYE
jgi:hypothetical protein